MNIDECLNNRRSVRDFNRGDILNEEFEEVLQAARMAPSAGNCQPWFFYVVKKEELIEEMRDILINSISAPPGYIKKYGSLFNARYLICASLNMDKRWYHGSINPRELRDEEDALDNGDYFAIGAAISNMLLKAHSMGIGSCWCNVSRESRGKIEKLLKVEGPFRLAGLVAVGKYDVVPPVPEKKKIGDIYKVIE